MLRQTGHTHPRSCNRARWSRDVDDSNVPRSPGGPEPCRWREHDWLLLRGDASDRARWELLCH
jgi:hypothetical protein